MASTPRFNPDITNKIRVRVCGVLVENNKILLIKHKNIGPNGVLWIPPGGGLEFGETFEECLKREFVEETNLEIEVGKLLFINQFVEPPLHAVEFFFQVKSKGGTLKMGIDPEMNAEDQIISDLKFKTEEELNAIHQENLHNVFVWLKNKEGLISFDSLLNLEVKYLN